MVRQKIPCGRRARRAAAVMFGLGLALAPVVAQAAEPAPAKPAPAAVAVTTADPAIDLGDLKLLLEPLTRAELELEATGWFTLLRAKVREVAEAELAVRRKNREIVALDKVKVEAKKVAAASAEVQDKAQDASAQGEAAKAEAAKKLAEANAKLAKSVEQTKKQEAASAAPAAAVPAATAPGAPGAGEAGAAPAAPVPVANDQEIMRRAVETAQKKAEQTGDTAAVVDKVVAASKEANVLSEVKELAEKAPAAAGETVAAAQSGSAPTSDVAADTAKTAGTLVSKVEEAAAAKSEVKVQLIDYSTQLGNERTAITDRLKLVLDELELKGGKAEDVRQYIAAVGGLKIDVADQTAAIARIKSWLLADEGGLRWARNLGIFLAYVVAAMVLAWIVRGVLDRTMRMAGVSSELLQNFIVGISGKVVVFMGILAGLSALEVNLAPLLAVIGAAGFVVAFALQGTLSNLASGLLIMVNEPFDVGDEVEVAGGIKGRIKEVTMFQTVILTEDKMVKIVPNNSIWGGVIINLTMGTVTHEDGTKDVDPADGVPPAAGSKPVAA